MPKDISAVITHKYMYPIYPYVGIIQIRLWVQTKYSVLSLLPAGSPFVSYIIALIPVKCNSIWTFFSDIFIIICNCSAFWRLALNSYNNL